MIKSIHRRSPPVLLSSLNPFGGGVTCALLVLCLWLAASHSTVVQAAPIITLSQAQLKLNGLAGGPDPDNRAFRIINSGPIGSTLNYTISANQPWLNTSPAGGSLAAGESVVVTVSAITAGMTGGGYNGALNVIDSSANNSPKTIYVSLNLNSYASIETASITSKSPDLNGYDLVHVQASGHAYGAETTPYVGSKLWVMMMDRSYLNTGETFDLTTSGWTAEYGLYDRNDLFPTRHSSARRVQAQPSIISWSASGDFRVLPGGSLDMRARSIDSRGYVEDTSRGLVNSPYTASISATASQARANPYLNGLLTVQLSQEATGPITMNYIVTGTAQSGTDFLPLPGIVAILPGASTAVIPIIPISVISTGGTVSVTLTDGNGYVLETNKTATVEIGGGPPTCTLTATPALIAAGGFSTLTASCSPAATFYFWSSNAGFSFTVASGTVSPAVTTIYTVTGGNTVGTGNTARVTVTVPFAKPPHSKDPRDNPKDYCLAVGTDKNAPGIPPAPSSASKDPVDLATGYFYDTLNLMEVAAAGAPLQMNLSYNSGNPVAGSAGFGWGHPYQHSLADLTVSIAVTWPDRHVSIYNSDGAGGYTNSAADASDTLAKNPDGSYTLTDRRQKTYNFDATRNLVSTVDRLGFIRNFTYLANGNLDKVTDALSGRFLQFAYDGQNRVTSVNSAGTGTVTIAYSTAGDLSSVADALGNVTIFTYDANHRLLTKVNALGATTVTNTYDAVTGRVTTQDDGLTATPLENFTYATDVATGNPYTSYLNPAGGTTRQNFDAGLNLLSTVDPLGGTETHSYDPVTGTRTSYKDPLNNQTQFTYDASGYILSRTDALGHVASYAYDASHNIVSSTDEAGNVTSMTYGPNHQLLSKTDPVGGVTAYTYNAQGLLATATAPTGGVTRYTYDAQGQLTSKVDPAGLTISYTYDAAGRMLTRTDGAGNVWTMTYDLMGHVLSTSDPLGNATRYTYDPLGRVATKTAPGGGITRYAYDIHDNLTSLTDPLGGVTTFAYDADDNIIATTDALGHVSTLTRDPKGRIVSKTDRLGNATTMSYDAADAPTSTQDALSNRTSFAYDSLRRLTVTTDPLSNSTGLAYDAVSRVTSNTDAKGNATSFAYDAVGQLVSATNAMSGNTSQIFDRNGNRQSFTDANGNATTFALDSGNRITRIATADGGATSYTYNNQNLVATATNGRGQVATYNYNSAGQLVTLADPAGTTTYTYDANGNVLTVGDARGTATYAYDLLNRITSYTDVFGNRIDYAYDAVGNLTALTYPGNKVVSYVYDAANRMISVTDWSGRATAYTYDARGNVTAISRANGTSGAFTYDAKGKITAISETAAGSASLYTIAYTYDGNGNITSEVMTPAATPPPPTAATMTYGADNRLSAFNEQPVTYDSDGNMTLGPLNGVASTYSYDSRSRLSSIGSTSYIYDAQGYRVSATNSGVVTRYVVDPNAALTRVLMETDGAGTPTAYYVYGIGLISRSGTAGTYQTYHYDVRGSTLKLTDSTGTVTDRYRYGPYAELVSTTGATANPFRYNGRDGVMTDPNGLYYMRARYYLPEAKRFVSRDPLLGGVDQSLTLNRYAYVSGNPVNFLDPSGYESDDGTTGSAVSSDMFAAERIVDSAMQQVGYSDAMVSRRTGSADFCKTPQKEMNARMTGFLAFLQSIPEAAMKRLIIDPKKAVWSWLKMKKERLEPRTPPHAMAVRG